MNSALARVREWLGADQPECALVLGSGLGAIAGYLQHPRRLSYREIPGFPSSTVAGHRGELVAGMLGDHPVLCQSGRFHGYEGHDAATGVGGVRLFAELGIGHLIVTNAAGGIAPRLTPGSLMLITDQVNLSFGNPLFGAVRPGEPRFPDMSAPFDVALAQLAVGSATDLGIQLERGVYAGVAGPSYETPAEIRMLRTLGADAVGMSTVQEIVAARSAGLRCLGISVVTNRAAGLGSGALSHEDVLAASTRAGESLARLLLRTVTRLDQVDVVPVAGTL